ncbi:MAG: hypothetical protein CMH57_09605 [Myxococcales bacterium]|nr:hypothetical protein [Myxococcales bacterium]
MFGTSSKRVNYKEKAEGIWGEFVTPAGKVNFLMTKARLVSTDITLESRLTSLLCPVREVLDIKRMNFNQLLQRDLDDHRVATELLPYLIQPSRTGPAFFPPILAALLPFKGMEPVEEFPGEDYKPKELIPDFGEQTFEEWNYGSAYRFQRMIEPNGQPHPVKFGRLSWNEELAKLVVLDGQHRAMGLLAIERTLSGTWGHSKAGGKYRHFYEHRVEALMEEAEQQGGIDLSQVEYPVTLCWFPEYNGQGRNPHVAARKLFVDVNKNARQPSEARLVLLSDTKLLNIFTRSLLNRLREKNPPLPLHVVEYDNPDKESSRPVRWSVFTNITMLQSIVEKAVFGPPKYIQDLSLTFRGRVSEERMDKYMRDQLAIDQIFANQIEEDERTIERSTLGNENFPQYNKKAQLKLINRFMERWGDPILKILGHFLPYKRHIEAIQSLKDHWIADDSVASLARDAMFEGVGMYWTLRASDAHWRERRREGLVTDRDKPEIVKAWKVIEDKGNDFKTLRAQHLLGSTSKESVNQSESLYSVVNTYACQVGAIMTVATVNEYQDNLTAAEVADILVRSWNAALEGRPVTSRDRMLLLSKDEKWPLNMIPKMDSPHAVYFRYFFLQLLEAEEAKAIWVGRLDSELVERLTSECRWVYFNYLVKEKAKGYRRTEPTWSKSKRQEVAKADVSKELSTSLLRWFDISKETFQVWLDADEASSSEDDEDDDEQMAGGGEGREGNDEPEDELLEELDDLLS